MSRGFGRFRPAIAPDFEEEDVTIRSAIARDALARPTVYSRLRGIARSYLGRERADHTLQPTALVHEAIIRMGEETESAPEGRGALIAKAARIMRLTLVDHARRRNAQKRQAGGDRLPLDEALARYEERSIDLFDLHDALARLEGLDPRLAAIVELRFFGGLTIEETAAALGVSRVTVDRGWSVARAWLFEELRKDQE